MAREEYLITTSVDGHERPSVWNSEDESGIDYPERWNIRRSPTGFTLTHVAGKALRITDAMIGPDAYFELPRNQGDPRKVYVKLEKLRPIRAAFMPVALPHGVQYGPSQVFASAGVREYLIAFEAVEGTYKAFIEKEAIFQLGRGPNGDFQIVASRGNVRFKVFGQRSKALPQGVALGFRPQDASRSAILWGNYWWRFNQIPTPEILPPDEREDEELEADSRAFKQLGKVVGTVMLVLLLAVKFLYQPPLERHEEKSINIEIQKPHVIPLPPPPKPPEAEKPKPKEPEKPKPPKQKVEKPKPKPKPPKPKPEPPKPKPQPPKPKPKVLKPEPPKPKPVVKAPVPPKVVKPPPKIVPPPKITPPTPPKLVKPPPPIVLPKVTPPPAVTAAPPKPDPTKVAKAALSKSLNFLSSGPASKANLFTTVPTQKFQNRYSNAGAAALQADTRRPGSSILSNMATNANPDGPISTKGARNISSALSLGGGTKGKSLNEVQGKVSINQLYSGGDAGAGIGEALTGGKSGVSVSGVGKISEALIEKILAKHLAKFQYCYEKALLSDPSLTGQIVFQWAIAPGGSVSGVSVVRSQMNNAKLHQCISSEIGRISFSPGPTGGSVTIQHPFAFSASTL